jgi:hypothetical protein
MTICVKKTFPLTNPLWCLLVLFLSSHPILVYAADEKSCRREAIETVAKLRSDSASAYTEEAIALAVSAAQVVCLKKPADASPSEPLVKSDEVKEPRQNIAPVDQETLFGIPVGSSRRNPGHKRLKRR